MKKRAYVILVLLIAVLLSVCVSAEEAEKIPVTLTSGGFSEPWYAADGSERSYTTAWGAASLTVTAEKEFSSLYVVFDKVPGEWSMDINGAPFECGKNGFLHEYIELPVPASTVTLNFPKATVIDEVYAFGAGDTPANVQKWEVPCEKADVMLLSSHCDDEQLFFAGILPYYKTVRGLEVQVVYLTNNWDTHERPHEMLDGLWAVGITNYPVVAPFADLYSESYDGAVAVYANSGVTLENITEYTVENIRRFKPQVLITHDEKGEYGHGTHLICAEVAKDAIVKAEDAAYHTASAELYGTHSVKKTYLHLYAENPIVFSAIDEPFDALGGKTPFEVTREGFDKHTSQHWTWFYRWMYGEDNAPVTKAADITTYSPLNYGLYRSTVGEDVLGGDFFENLTSYEILDNPPETEPETETEPVTETETESETETEAETERETRPLLPPDDGEPEKGGLDSDMLTAIGILVVLVLAGCIAFAYFMAGKVGYEKRRRK